MDPVSWWALHETRRKLVFFFISGVMQENYLRAILAQKHALFPKFKSSAHFWRPQLVRAHSKSHHRGEISSYCVIKFNNLGVFIYEVEHQRSWNLFPITSDQPDLPCGSITADDWSGRLILTCWGAAWLMCLSRFALHVVTSAQQHAAAQGSCCSLLVLLSISAVSKKKIISPVSGRFYPLKISVGQ